MGLIDQGSFINDHEFIGRQLCRGSAIPPQAHLSLISVAAVPAGGYGVWPQLRAGMGSDDLDFGIAVRSIGRQCVRGGLVSLGIRSPHSPARRVRYFAARSAMRVAIP